MLVGLEDAPLAFSRARSLMRKSVSGHAPSEREAPLPRSPPEGCEADNAAGVPTLSRLEIDGLARMRPPRAVDASTTAYERCSRDAASNDGSAAIHDPDHAAAAAALLHPDLHGDAFHHSGDVRDDADLAAAALKRFEGIDG